jgi:uncharacterized membrane protein YccF (DUF307 family)
MRFAGNVIWFIFGGWLTALIWLLGAVVFAISIIGLPLTRAAIELAQLSAWPFGKDVVHIRELDERDDGMTQLTGAIGFIFNVLWAVTFGLALCLSHVVLGVLWCLTLVGIPFGLQHFKLAGLSLWPVGRRVVDIELANEMRQDRARTDLARYRSRDRSMAPAPAGDDEVEYDEAPAVASERRQLPRTRALPAGPKIEPRF